MGSNKNKGKPYWLSFWKRVTAVIIAVLMMFLPATAFADMQGIDVSSWQPSDITSRVTADFAIVKTTQGLNYVNPNANAQIANAKASGKEIGVYHYAGGNDCVAEADYFLQHSGNYVREAVLFLDWESEQNAAWGNADWSTCWVNRVKERTNGVIPMVYVQASAVNQVAGARNAGAGLWVAQYANMEPTGYQSNPWNLGAYGEAMRQYTATGVLEGYSGYLDLNVFRGDKTAWRKYANPSGNGGGSASASKPAPTPSQNAIDWDALATAVLRGEYGNLPQRKVNLDTAYGAGAYDKVQAIVNQRYGQTGVRQTVQQSNGITHTIVWGDTIWGLAKRYNAWPMTAWRTPSGNINVIHPGDVVTYGGGAVSTGTQSAHGVVTVRSGDTLGGIAAYYGVNMYSIHGYRSGNPALIYPGETVYW